MLAAKNLTQKYKEKFVVQDFNYSFAEGNIYGIIGPNGAGKSTLLRLLTGTEAPVSGRVQYEDKEMRTPPPDIGVVWQKPYVFHTTAEENIRYGLRVRRWNRHKTEDRVNYLIDVLRLEDVRRHWAPNLSIGETARVALARAIAFRPKTLVLDEVTANLDPANTKLVEEILSLVQRQEKITIILVTHDMFQAKRLAHYTLYMKQGRLIEAGPTDELFSSPRTLDTQRFITGEL